MSKTHVIGGFLLNFTSAVLGTLSTLGMSFDAR
jgi:hypothetical protein